MAGFFRIYNNQLSLAGNTKRLGFNSNNPMFIPDEYLEKKEFIVMRTCHGIGDWCLISGLPRLLKEKYPDCKVYIPSSTMLKNIYGSMLDNWGYGTYDCSQITHDVFQNNPHVDGFIDSSEDEIFHDHYRIYNEKKDEIPLTEQMLKFWQFNENEMEDYTPELYFSKEEKELGDKIIKEHVGDKSFGSLMISNRYDFTQDKIIVDLLKENDLPYFYYSSKPLHQTDFNFIKKALDLNHIPTRIQLYIRSKAKINIGNQCGTNHCIVRYSDVYEVQRQPILGHNFVKGENYI